jgi:outer membrane protein assembly factor BamB
LVLVGGHGTGALTALSIGDGEERWRTRVPNWIHQDPVSDGRYVVVGFGDNEGSFHGEAPSGVAAYELASGRHLWTRFDETSVMTSAVVVGNTILYATAGGVTRKRSLTDGRLIQEVQLPGGAIMAPLAVTGDTVVATLDRNVVCALRLATLARLWCRRFPHLRMLGHAAPAVAAGRVFVSGLTTTFAMTMRDISQLDGEARTDLLRRLVLPPHDDDISGQTFFALDLASGKTVWHASLFPMRREVSGHIAGTAALERGSGVMVLPAADRVVAFDADNGEVRWSFPAHESRGPPLLVDGHVVVAGSDGVIEVRDLSTGVLTCALRRRVGWDRAGPVQAGNLVVFANLKGGIEAIPVSALLRCNERPPARTTGGAKPIQIAGNP